MTFYPYRCPCGHHAVISKPMAEAAAVEVCIRCGKMMDRIYDSPPAARVHMGTPTFHKQRGK